MVDRYINEVLPEKKDGKNQGHQADVSDYPIADNRVVDIERIAISDFVLEYGKHRLG